MNRDKNKIQVFYNSTLALVFILILSSFGSAALVQILFSEYPIGDGNYYLVGFSLDGPGVRANRLNQFYVDDPKVLNEIRHIWIVGDQTLGYACGYHYGLFLMKDRKIVEEYKFNLDRGCNTVTVGDERVYQFEPQNFYSYLNKFKKMKKNEVTFGSFEEARAFYYALSNNTQVLFYEEPDWLEYEGAFDIDYDCRISCYDLKGYSELNFAEQRRCINDEKERCLANAKSEFEKLFPNHRFKIMSGNIGPDEFEVVFLTNRDFYRKFNHYYSKSEWRSYDPVFTFFSKKNCDDKSLQQDPQPRVPAARRIKRKVPNEKTID